MKVSSAPPSDSFQAFDLTIRVETKAEAQALYAIFNRTQNAALLGDDLADAIRQEIGRAYYVVSEDVVIANGITYGDYYRGGKK